MKIGVLKPDFLTTGLGGPPPVVTPPPVTPGPYTDGSGMPPVWAGGTPTGDGFGAPPQNPLTPPPNFTVNGNWFWYNGGWQPNYQYGTNPPPVGTPPSLIGTQPSLGGGTVWAGGTPPSRFDPITGLPPPPSGTPSGTLTTPPVGFGTYQGITGGSPANGVFGAGLSQYLQNSNQGVGGGGVV